MRARSASASPVSSLRRAARAASWRGLVRCPRACLVTPAYRRVPCDEADELESIREALANHKTQVDQTARLDTLSDLGEAAAKGLELALQQLEDLASIKYGYVKTEATPGRPRRAGAPPLSPMQSPSALSDPPTPKSDDLMLSNAARSLLGARAVPQ